MRRSTTPERRTSRLDVQRATVRLGLGLAAGIGAWLLLPGEWSWVERLTGGWDVTALLLLALSWWIILRSTPEQTRQRAGSDDPGRSSVWVLMLLGSLFSLISSVMLLRAPVHGAGARSLLWGLALGSALGSWALTHTAYALRYAHLYYRDRGDGEGGLDFPGKGHPCDMDFAYFAFTVGMCFQTSDVSVSRHEIRRAVLVHALLSFGYSTVILAVTLNLLFGHLG